MLDSNDRRGGVLLAPVLVLLMCMLVVGLGRHTQGTRAVRSVHALQIGTKATDVAHSALQEARLALGRKMNDPEDALYRSLRTQPAQNPVRLRTPGTIALLREDSALAGFQILEDGVQARIADRSPAGLSTTEIRGVWELTATVRHKPSGLTRVVTEKLPFRLTLLSCPFPYNPYTVLVLDAGNLVGADANWRMDRSQEELARLSRQVQPQLVDQMKQVVAYANGVASAARTRSSSDIPSLDSHELVAPLADLELPAVPEIADSVTAPLHHFPSSYALYLRDPDVGLAELDLAPRLANLETAATESRKAYERAFGEHQAIIARISALSKRGESMSQVQVLAEASELYRSLKPSVRKLARALQVLATSDQAILEAVRRFEDLWLETGGDATRWLRQYAGRLDPAEWERKASWKFAGPGAARSFVSWLARYKEEGVPVNGIAYVSDPADVLDLSSATIHGKLVVVATGPVHLQDVRLADANNDLLVVQSQGEMKAAGRVEACLIPLGPFQPRSDLSLSGSVVMDRVRDPARLAGTVENRLRRFSTETPAKRSSHLYAALSPWSSSVAMVTR